MLRFAFASAFIAAAVTAVLVLVESGGAHSRRAERWYHSPATQCVVRHEARTWDTVSPGGTYHGRFQMDRQFERDYGRRYARRWGRASNWPAWAQVATAYLGWRKRGWAPWPRTAAICGLR